MTSKLTQKPQRLTTVMVGLVVMAAHVCRGQDRNQCWVARRNAGSDMRPCFDAGLCRCFNDTADCSSHHGLLTYVPRLPIDVQVLNFSSNNLSHLADDFFSNVSHVWLLDLCHNGLTSISPRAFRGLRSLATLLLNNNPLSYTALTPVFHLRSLVRLEILCSGLSPTELTALSRSSMKELTLLNVSLNNIGSFYTKDLQSLTNLRTFVAQQNTLYNLTTSRLQNLEFLDLQFNRLFDFPKTCDPVTGQSLFPNLRQLLLDFNMISSISDPVCLPKLYILTLEFNRFQLFQSNTFGMARFPSLEKLELTQMEDKISRLEGFTFNNSNLLYLGLALNYLDLSSQIVLDDDAFAGSTKVIKFYFDHCLFKKTSNERLHKLLQSFKSIRSLYLGYCEIQSITPETFAPFQSLQYLYLYGNLLTVIPDGCFTALTGLSLLSLDSNMISSISTETFDDRTRERLHRIDLSGNPFYCSCDIRWFQDWLNSQPAQFASYGEGGYMCDSLVNTSVQSFRMNEQACLLGQAAATFTIAVIAIALVVFVAFVVFFRFRWHLRLVMYEAFHHRGTQEQQRRNFTYDVFVGYAVEDRKWVMHELLPVLEGQWNLRVCVHERDFVPGKHIVDNIADCVQDSHKILMVLSPDYARSEWCQFELRYSQCCVMDREEVLVLVLLHDVESREMSSAMFAVLQTTTYIQWADSVDARDSFWGRLALAVTGINRS